MKPDFLAEASRLVAACTRPAALAAIIKLVNLIMIEIKNVFRQMERKEVESVNESQSRSWYEEQSPNQIARGKEHSYIPLDPDIDQTSPSPLHLQRRSPGIVLTAIQGLVLFLEGKAARAEQARNVTLSLSLCCIHTAPGTAI